MTRPLPTLLCALALFASCTREQHTNVLLITIDTLRNDHCSVSGYARRTTPRLEALAREGARLALAYAPCATTGPSHASMFTSLYPITHGLVKNGSNLDPKFPTLAGTLRQRGYATAAVVSSFVLDSKFGYDHGFETYDDRFAVEGSTTHQERFEGHEVVGGFDQRADVATRKAVGALGELARARRPFFLFVHYFDPHSPYAPPPGWAGRFASRDTATDELAATIERYDEEIAFADHEIGRLLDALRDLGLEHDTLVVLAGDHGEGLMQHGHMEHGVHIYEEAVRVPLMFRLPGRIAAGRVLSEPVELLDVFPTVLQLTGAEPMSGLQGRSLADALAGRAALDPRRAIHLHRRHYVPGMLGNIPVAGEKFGLRLGPWKYIEGEEEGTRELFNLDDDPGERVNRFDSSPDVAERLRTSLQAWKDAFDRNRMPGSVSPEDRERLRALGYTD